MDHERAIASVGRADRAQVPALFAVGKPLLLVARADRLAIGLDPDLQEMHRLALRVIELAVAHAGAGRHDLDLARG